MVKVEIKGLQEIQAKLESLQHNVARRLLRNAMRTAANVWREEIIRRAPRRSGILARSITMQQTVNGELEGEIRVGYFKRAWYAIILEFGRRASKKGEKLPGITTSKSRKSKGASYSQARPFIRPAYESKKEEVLQKFVEEGKKILADEARK